MLDARAEAIERGASDVERDAFSDGSAWRFRHTRMGQWHEANAAAPMNPWRGRGRRSGTLLGILMAETATAAATRLFDRGGLGRWHGAAGTRRCQHEARHQRDDQGSRQ